MHLLMVVERVQERKRANIETLDLSPYIWNLRRDEVEYPVIDMKRTGSRIKGACQERGISAKEIKDFMKFSSAQSVYDWFHGKSMPSLDNFYALSRLLHMPMESLLCASDQEKEDLLVLYEPVNRTYRGWERKHLGVYRKMSETEKRI